MSAFPWRPVKEYSPIMGQVLVWLSYTMYSKAAQNVVSAGVWVLAYQVTTTNGDPVWVTAHDSVPCETTGRVITHFATQESP